jgi:hypothetical protein
MFAQSKRIALTILPLLTTLSASACDKTANGVEPAAQTGAGGNGSVPSQAPTPVAPVITPAEHRAMGPGTKEHGTERAPGLMGMATGGHAHGGATAKGGHHQ